MPQIIVFGDTDISPLYISINGSRDLVVSGKWARRISVGSGPCHIMATTVSKTQRAMQVSSDDFLGWAANAMTKGTNTSLAGTIDLEDDDVWLFQVKQTLTKTEVYNGVVDASEAGKYVNMNAVLDYGVRAPGEKNKWAVFFLCLFFGVFGVHRFYERKIGTGILYLLTMGLGGCGVVYDLIKIWQRVDLYAPTQGGTAVRKSSGGGVIAVVLIILIALAVFGGLSIFAGSPRYVKGPSSGRNTTQAEPPAGEETDILEEFEVLEEDPVDDQGFIFPNSGSALLDQRDVEALSDSDLTYAINEIYARHGYIFQKAELREYYGQFSWYAGKIPSAEFSTDCFNQTEQQNMALLVGERSRRSASG